MSSFLEIQKDFPSYINQLTADQIPKTEFWILMNDIIVGRLNLNHELTEPLKIRGGHIGYGIAKSFRNKGIATAALASALKIAQQKGIKKFL